MSIASICASLQPRSTNEVVLTLVEQQLEATGQHVQRIDGLVSLPPFRPDVEVPDVVRSWADALAAADGVVIATPEYAAGPPGALKNGLDWLVGLSSLYRTPVAVLCAGSTGGAFTIESLVRTLSYQGALTVATLGIGAIRTKLGADGEISDEATRLALHEFVDRLRRALGASEPELLALVTPVVARHGVDPARFGLSAG